MDPRQLALWRLERIDPLLEEGLTRKGRRARAEELARVPVIWPSGKHEAVSVSTLYRWRQRYLSGGLVALYPAVRKDKGEPRPGGVRQEWIEYALELLREDHERSLSILQALVAVRYKVTLPTSTLHRHLQRRPEYKRLRQESPAKLRRRFEADRPHKQWQTDAKGPFRALVGGERLALHIVSVLDDATRALLAAIVVRTVDLAAAVRVFRKAAARWGLPGGLYADKASIFDSNAFRLGLAEFGNRRIPTTPRNAAARGKIERYHRVLKNWFIRELKHQVVHDLEHLQQLLDGCFVPLYMEHYHRHLRKSPADALAGRVSDRVVTASELSMAFLQHKHRKAHPKTGELDLGKRIGLVRVPKEYAGHRVDLRVDPVDPRAYLVLVDGRYLPLGEKAPPPPPRPPRRGEGRLQALYERYQGRELPLSETDFGLPEIRELLSEVVGRTVPRDSVEADLVQTTYRRLCPLPSAPTRRAFEVMARHLGEGRPLQIYLDRLERLVERAAHDNEGED